MTMPKSKHPLEGRGLLLSDDSTFSDDSILFSSSSTRKVSSMQWFPGPVVDQGRYSSCVGCGFLGFMNAEPIRSKFVFKDMHEFYLEAQRNDDMPGEEPEYYGTSIQAGVKVATNRGWVKEAIYTKSAAHVWNHIVERGPVIVGTMWYTSMAMPRNSGFGYATGSPLGGHCYLIYGVSGIKNAFICRNSHGVTYGLNGDLLLEYKTLEFLLSQNGAVAVSLIQKL